MLTLLFFFKAVLYKKGQASCPHIPAFTTYSFPSLSSLYSIEEIPSCLSFLSTHTSQSYSTQTFSFLDKKIENPNGSNTSFTTEIPVNPIMSSLCYHILSILGNLFNDRHTVKELIEQRKLSTFLDLLFPLSGDPLTLLWLNTIIYHEMKL